MIKRNFLACEHCGGDIDIANPTGFCNHVYFPENVNTALTPDKIPYMVEELQKEVQDINRAPLFMRDCCEAMGWQGGTVHEVIKTIREMRQTKENDNKEISRLRAVTSGLESYIKELQNNGAKLLHEKDAAEARLMIKAQRHYHETLKTASLAGEIEDKNKILIDRNAEIIALQAGLSDRAYQESFICAVMKWREFNFQRLMDFLKVHVGNLER